MADGRGGYRKPSGGPRVSGVGAASQRSDANQPVNVGRVGDSEDLTHGDRQKLEAAVKQRPIGRAQAPELGSGGGAPGGPIPGMGGTEELPENIFAMPSNREDEPMTEGLPFGEGGGPEVLKTNQAPSEKEQLVRFLMSRPNASPQWQSVLSSVAEEMRVPQQPAMRPMPASEPGPEPMPEVEMPDEVPVVDDVEEPQLADEEPMMEDESVEEPSAEQEPMP